MLMICVVIPGVSAEVLYDETIEYYQFTGGSGAGTATGNTYPASAHFKNLIFSNIQNQQDLGYIVIDTAATTIHEEGVQTFTYTLGGKTNDARMHVKYLRNMLGGHTQTRYTLFFDGWDVSGLIGSHTISTPMFYTSGRETGITYSGDSPVHVGGNPTSSYRITCVSGINFKNHIRITDNYGALVVTLNRVIDGVTSASTLNVYGDSDNLIYTDTVAVDVTEHFLTRDVTKIEILSVDREFIYPISSVTSPSKTPPVNVYIKNSQTGALLADARLSILAATGGTETEIINATLPGGTATYTLQPTGGGLPNPDYYRAVATVPGYTQIIENHSFTLNGPHDVIIEMRPDTGGPTDPERCYLEFYVRDLNANPIPSASVQCDNRILQTNSAGYAVFEVAKNASHPWIAKKSGYVTIEGTATVADGPRYVVNVVLGPGSIPTYTPTGGATPTPTATPTGWGPGQWTPDPGASIGDNARSAAKQTLLEGLQVGQLLFMLTMLMLIMAVLNSRRR